MPGKGAMDTLIPTDAEQKLINAARDGLPADFSSANSGENDPADGAGWGDERTIRAEIIYALATGACDDWPVHPKGIQLAGAKIEGSLNFGGAEIRCRLILEACHIAEPIILVDATAKTISLKGSHICGGIQAERVTVRGSVVLNGVKAFGEAKFVGAKISGQLLCKCARFFNPCGRALNADGAEIGNGVFLDEGFTANGEVRFVGARIGVELKCRGSHFCVVGQNALALTLDGLRTAGLFLDKGFTAIGEVSLVHAEIGKELNCSAGSFGNLILQRAQVSGALVMKGLVNPAANQIDLMHARVGLLADDKASWPAKENLRIDGFKYGAIVEGSPRDAESRLEWLARAKTEDFSIQPYEQLEKVLRAAGDERGAIKVYVEKRREIRKNGQMTRSARAWDRILDYVVGYGYKAGRVFWWSMAVIVIWSFPYWLWFSQMQAPLVASQTVVVSSRSATGGSAVATVVGEAKPPANPVLQCADHVLWSCFYSLDVFLPFGKLGMISAHPLRPRHPLDFCFYFFECCYVFEMLAGWLAAGLIAAAAAGVIQK